MTKIYVLDRYSPTTGNVIESVEITDEDMVNFFNKITRNRMDVIFITTKIAKQFKESFGDKLKINKNCALAVYNKE